MDNNSLEAGLALISIYPKHPKGYILIARHYISDANEPEEVKKGLPYLKYVANLTKMTDLYFQYSIASRWVRNYDEALWGMKKVLEVKPENPQYVGHNGYILYNMGRQDEGISELERSIDIVEKAGVDAVWTKEEKCSFIDFIRALCEYYCCFNELIEKAKKVSKYAVDKFSEADPDIESKINTIKRYVDYDPLTEFSFIADFGKKQIGQAYFMAGQQCQAKGDLIEASTEYMYACEYLPTMAIPHYAAAMTLRFIGQHEIALGYITKATELEPTNMMYVADLLHLLKATCRWTEFDEKLKIVTELIDNQNYVELNEFRLAGMYWGFSMEIMLKLSANYCKTLEVPTKNQCRLNKKYALNKKLKIAYISSNYRNHAQGSQLESFFKEHNRDQFEVFAISIYPAIVPLAIERRDMLKAQVDHWIDAHNMEPEEIAKLIKRKNIDIIIDLNGHADHPQLKLFAYKPAPVQISFLGYPGTTGAEFMDFYVGDPISTPVDTMGQHFAEKLLIMPNTYQLTEHKGQYPVKSFVKEKDNDNVIFCNFNQPVKIEHKIFTSWMNILKNVDNSVLWLLEHTAIEKMKDEATKQGVDPERLIFKKMADKKDHLARMQTVDLLLDTTIYNAHTSAGDALWAGLPILTILGDTMPSRVCASMVTSAGFPEMIVNSIDEYEHRAIHLGNNIGELRDIRKRVESKRETMPLFDTVQFVKDFEKGLKHTWSQFVKNGPGKFETFNVSDLS
jgi:predicted O-linked N-acetylglucosamine transferase (SPINDLY family)